MYMCTCVKKAFSLSGVYMYLCVYMYTCVEEAFSLSWESDSWLLSPPSLASYVSPRSSPRAVSPPGAVAPACLGGALGQE